MSEMLLPRSSARARRSALGICLVLAFTQSAVAQDEPADSDEAPAADPSAAEPADAAEADAAELEAADAAAMEEGAGDAELKRAPPKGKGVVWGSVKDTKFSEGVIDAQVQVVGRKEKTFANIDGGYRLELPPGKYSIRVSFELYQPARVEAVEVKAGEVTRIDFNLVPDETSVEEVVIEDEADLASTEGQALGRKRSAVVGDGLGRAEIARTPDRNAAEAAQRVVGATLVGNRFVFVRGLGERYSNALLNGTPLPSTEPDRNSVPLDLFPSLVLDGLTIVKQFTPDMPADFAGGSVRITTRDFPKQPLFQISANGTFNTASTFRTIPTYYGSSREWLGYDGGRRAFPEGIPFRKLDSAGATEEERVAYGHKFNSSMGTQLKTAPPNFGVSVVAGNAYKLDANTKLGAMLALSYSRSYQLRQTIARKFYSGPLPDMSDTLLVGDEFAGRQSIESVRWGTFGSLSLERNRNTTIKLVAFRSQNADDQSVEFEGRYNGISKTYHTSHLEYVSRALNFVQLGGEHRYPKLKGLEIAWHGSLAVADRDQPDTRDVGYLRATRDGVEGWSFATSSGQHSFLKQSDTTRTLGLDVTQPLIEPDQHRTSIKAGAMVTSRDREFQARRFQLQPSRQPGPIYDALAFCPGIAWDGNCPNRLFRREAVRPDGLRLDEWTLNFDQYVTGLDVYALYAMVDTKPFANFRAIGGMRSEITYQAFSGFNPFDRADTEQGSQIYQADYLPALSLIYATSTKSNARLGLSQTLARPQLRELSPALSTSFSGDRSVQGNPGLVLTKITNVDLRYEYFPTLKEVLAVSLFYKRFKSPIEEIVDSAGLLSFTNAPKASLIGVELEGRQGLQALAQSLKDLTVIANLTLVKSEVDLGRATRPLAYQSPWVVNLSLDYEHEQTGTDARLLYNVFGPRITVVGTNKLPETYELPRHQIDITVSQKFGKHFQLKGQAQNLLGQPFVFAYRNHPGYRFVTRADGSQVFESLGRTPIVSRYNPGAAFTLSASYTY